MEAVLWRVSDRDGSLAEGCWFHSLVLQSDAEGMVAEFKNYFNQSWKFWKFEIPQLLDRELSGLEVCKISRYNAHVHVCVCVCVWKDSLFGLSI